MHIRHTHDWVTVQRGPTLCNLEKGAKMGLSCSKKKKKFLFFTTFKCITWSLVARTEMLY